MNSLRPTSISDAALLQRLESLSSNSEPSSPTLHVGLPTSTGPHIDNAPLTIADATSTKSTPLSPNSTQYKNNNNNITLTFTGFMNSGSNSSGLAKISKMDYQYGTREIFCRIASHLVILGCVGLPVLAFHLLGVSYKRGFFCDDKTLKHPFRQNTVSNWMLFLMCFIIPISIVCQPILADGSSCNNALNVGRYVEDFTCSGSATPRMLKHMRLSFPSAHASFACFTMIYMAIYLQKRMSWERCKMVKHFMQFLLVMFAWYTSLTRVSDYQHHTTDVLAGSTIGAFYAVLMVSSCMFTYVFTCIVVQTHD
ncbi:PREDICTED: putative phosphatidate phosphatase [Rhagoletis zephyria]|uniref:putative phosphatidate phosphatase n=1 Tax=Rhagoletis zephyria TaxID=28612 RepID=UPI00081189CC|nr:PREDICTED: putative phosphatidate phosphatase [Rhagoletis zephyria]